MNIRLENIKNEIINAEITVSGSKSESNRLLVLQQFFPEISIENVSDSDDSEHMQEAYLASEKTINIGHAGTTMRFLTSYFSIKKDSEVVLTGSERMLQRPIKILVDALKDLGADITYENNVGYPPIRIKGGELSKDKVLINGNVSSQYISSLLLIAAKLKNGLEIELLGKITSIPYINMTLRLLNQVGINTSFEGNIIRVSSTENIEKKTVVVESDWSSASYFYSIIALSKIGSKVKLTAYKKDSLQGDSCLSEIYKSFGVSTTFAENTILLEKVEESTKNTITLDLKNAPDIAQTIAVTCFSERTGCDLTGLHTLKIKETDRLEALKEELTKLGANISVTNESLHLESASEINKEVAIKTYNDHRMAMAFAPIAMRVPVKILNAEVVTKSYQKFWEDMALFFEVERC